MGHPASVCGCQCGVAGALEPEDGELGHDLRRLSFVVGVQVVNSAGVIAGMMMCQGARDRTAMQY